MLPPSLDPTALEAIPGYRHYFRYPLHGHDFHALRTAPREQANARLLGYYAAKPLYGQLDGQGRVDRSAGFSGEVVTLFVPSPARSWRHASLLHARMPCDRVRRDDGKRNWPAILATARGAILRAMQSRPGIDRVR